MGASAAAGFLGFTATAAVVVLLLRQGQRPRTEELLTKWRAFEHLLLDISASLLDAPPEEVNGRVQRALLRVVEALELDRCALFVIRPGEPQADITHTAQAHGVPPLPHTIGQVRYPRLVEALRRGDSVAVQGAAPEIPSRAPAGGRGHGKRPLLLIPVSSGGGVLSGISFQGPGREVSRSEDSVSRLRLVGQILSSAISRARIEAALHTSEKKYRNVVDSQTDLICRYLPDTTLTFVNEAYCRYFRRTREQLIGRMFLELIPEGSRDMARQHVESLLEDPRAEVDEHEVLRPDGSIGWQQWTSYAILGRDGRVFEFQAVGRDITDRKRAQEAEDRLANASRLTVLGELAASIAHEIRQPLGAILSNTEAAEMLLESGGKSRIPEIREILSDIHREVLRASEVIQHIRSLVQHRPPQMQPLDLNDLVRDVVRFVAPSAREFRVRVDMDLTGSLPAVYGEQVQLQQVLLNLIVNGMDAMKETSEPFRRLTIRTRCIAGRLVEIEVIDAGHGIAETILPRLFQSFVTTRQDGLGLGLSLSRSIIESHGGTISAENNADGGATFRFLLPALDDTRESNQRRAS